MKPYLSIFSLLIICFSCGKETEYISDVSCLINGNKYEYYSTDRGSASSQTKGISTSDETVIYEYTLSAGKIIIWATDCTLFQKRFTGKGFRLGYLSYPESEPYVYTDGNLEIINHQKYNDREGLITAEFRAILVNKENPSDSLKIENGKMKVTVTYGFATRP